MNFDQLVRNDQIVQLLSKAVIGSLDNIEHVPDMVKEIIRSEMWRERRMVQTGEIVRFERFVDFVTTKPLEGLGTTISTLERLCREDIAALDLLDKVEKGPITLSLDNNSVYNVHAIKPYRPTGNTRARALRQLREHRPDLHERVMHNELSPHAAAVEAGFRKRKVAINLEDLDSASQTICRKLDHDEVLELIDWLYKALGDGE